MTASTTSLSLNSVVALTFGRRAVARTYVIFDPGLVGGSQCAVRLRLHVLRYACAATSLSPSTFFSCIMKKMPLQLLRKHIVRICISGGLLVLFWWYWPSSPLAKHSHSRAYSRSKALIDDVYNGTLGVCFQSFL